MSRAARGPECEACGSTDLALVNARMRWGKPWARFKCQACGQLRHMGLSAEPVNDSVEYDANGTHCPHCPGEETRVRSVRRPFSRNWPMDYTKRYHNCLDCGKNFRSHQRHSERELGRFRKLYSHYKSSARR